MTTSLVVTAIGPDRPGLVSLLSDAGQRFGASWTGSHMASLAGQFAGMIHFEVDDGQADALSSALRALESQGLRVVVATSRVGTAPVVRRLANLDLVGHDRPGIVRELSQALARLDVNIEELETHVTSAAMSGEPLFKLRARVAVPERASLADLRHGLEALANEMMIDVEFGAS